MLGDLVDGELKLTHLPLVEEPTLGVQVVVLAAVAVDP